jgi:hypothetical protein
MRLISSKTVSNSIVKYYSEVEDVERLYQQQLQLRNSLRPLLHEILDGNDYGAVVDTDNSVIRPVVPVKLRITNLDVINNILIVLQDIKGITITIKIKLKMLAEMAMNTQASIIKEFHLK